MSAQLKRMTAEEYLHIERDSPVRHEFFQGQFYAMAGASRMHSIILGNAYASLHSQLRRKPCEVYPNNMRVFVPRTGLYTYPDVVVMCGRPQFYDDKQDTLLNPIVLIEVLSPSTEHYDRGMKFQHYGSLESLRDYLLIAQDQQRIEHFQRQQIGQWLLHDVTSADQLVTIASIECTLNLDDIYAKVEFPPSEEGITRILPPPFP